MALSNRSRCHAKCTAFILQNTCICHPCVRYLNAVALQDTVRSNSSISSNDAPDKKYLKHKAKMRERLERADRTVLVGVMNDSNQALTLRKIQELKGVQALQNSLLPTNGKIAKITPLTNTLYFLEFERGWVHYQHKCVGKLGTKNAFKSQNLTSHLTEVEGTDLSSTIQSLYEKMRLPEANIQRNFYVASYVQVLLRRKVVGAREAMVLPFGSTASGLAVRNSSDLDLVWHDKLRTSDDPYVDEENLRKALRVFKKSPETITRIHPVLHAKVPIVKFVQTQLGIPCDLSNRVIDGPLMAEVMSWLNDYDERFYPLLLSLKLLFKNHKVSISATFHISSNTVHMLVIAFLQTKGILPPLKDVFHFKVKPDDQWETTYLNECNPKPVSHRDQTCLGDLFQEFLLFLVQKDFSELSVDVFNGDIVPDKNRPAREVLRIPNPFDFTRNMSRNVSSSGRTIYRNFCKNLLVKMSRTPTKDYLKLWKPGNILVTS